MLETFMTAVCRDMGEKSLIVAGDEKTAEKLQNSVLNFFERVYVYPKKDFIFMGAGNINNPFEHERMKILGKVLNGDFDVVITTLEAMLQYTMPGEKIQEYSIDLKIGGTIKDLDAFLDKLVAAGYKRAEIVEEPAKFSVRGGIIDIFSPSGEYPVRLELFGDEIDSMGIFDPLTQRRIENIKEFTVIPASETILDEKARKNCIAVLESLAKNKDIDESETERSSQTEHSSVIDRLSFETDCLKNNEDISSKDRFISCIYAQKACLLDYFDPDDLILFINESVKINEKQKASEQIMNETVMDLVEKGYIDGKNAFYSATLEDFNISRAKFKTVICDTFLSGLDMQLSGLYSFTSRQSPHFSEGFNILKEDLERYSSSGYKTAVMLDTDSGIKSFADYLEESGIKYILPDSNDMRDKYNDTENLPAGFVTIIKTPKIEYKNNPLLFDLQGFELPKQKFALITDSNSRSNKRADSLKSRGSRTSRDSGGKYAKTARQKIMSYTDLSVGDYVVHNNYGIGRFLGIERLEVSGGVQKDYIKIQYQGTDILYVPCNQLDLVSKYIGAGSEDSMVRLSKMGGPAWNKAKARAKKAARDIANELIKLYAARQSKRGHAFSPDTEWQKDFESLFEYAETDDQLICTEQIKEDMMQAVPMDRLLCGDVGFGKTEVALRAVFKCVSESKQAAVLVPTTILAWQHYQTMLSRFREFPVKIDFLSRFKSKKEQEAVIKKLKEGTVDVVIGTHRIIQKDIKFKDLGLLVVDEEQRFGVAHKEKLKQLAENIDVLTLTATPIPRTLNMALSGIRDMSVIEEAPRDRIPVQTYIFEYDEHVIAEAIKNEIRRGGQVFYLHNRVETIEQTAMRLSEIFEGEIKIGVGHGQMDEESLSRVWRNMLDGEIDVLVCTTIIESGIDVPDANTLIIEDADRLGLAQLHQIRGRVGRSNRRAYAYFTYPKNKVLTEIAAKRLKAIREYTEFGSGFKIAMRDLEIRGAGNLLGAEQHGQMDSIGYDLYVKILEKAVNDEKRKYNMRQKYGLEYDSGDDDYNDMYDPGTQPPPSINDASVVLDGTPFDAKGAGFAEPEPTECLIDIAVDAFIPNRYIESELLRIEIYKRIAAVENKDDADDLKDELIDRFGDIPRPVGNLIDIALIRNSACLEYIDAIENKDKKSIIIYSNILAQPYGQKTLEKWTIAASKMNGRLLLSMGQKPHAAYFLKDGENIIDRLKEIMNVLGEIK